HCQTLGYRCERTYQIDRTGNAEVMRRIFWTIYVSDKSLSLLLGCASCIQDFEIDSSPPVLPTNPALQPWDESFIAAIKVARNLLYSAAAWKADHSERSQHIKTLAAAVRQLRTELEKVSK
ncbi:uncharacterized protein B0T15DRAFT_383346, partial [Chaetomium strumarium]